LTRLFSCVKSEYNDILYIIYLINTFDAMVSEGRKDGAYPESQVIWALTSMTPMIKTSWQRRKES
jgi:hypothetical protein